MRMTDDTRERLEADIHHAADEMDRFYCGERFINTHKIIGWLDRQAAITERECRRPNWEYCETCEAIADLQDKLDEMEQTHIKLPLDADGVPIRPGDTLKSESGIDTVAAVDEAGFCFFEKYGISNYAFASHYTHIKPVAVEIVRCKDCRFYEKGDSGYWCKKSITLVPEDSGFCAWGERKVVD